LDRIKLLRGGSFDGAKYVADQAGAYWLLDEIALAQRFEKTVVSSLVSCMMCSLSWLTLVASADATVGEEFQLWKLKVDPDHTATLTCEDGNGKAVYSKAIEYTERTGGLPKRGSGSCSRSVTSAMASCSRTMWQACCFE
jgi:hypothetical protein